MSEEKVLQNENMYELSFEKKCFIIFKYAVFFMIISAIIFYIIYPKYSFDRIKINKITGTLSVYESGSINNFNQFLLDYFLVFFILLFFGLVFFLIITYIEEIFNLFLKIKNLKKINPKSNLKSDSNIPDDFIPFNFKNYETNDFKGNKNDSKEKFCDIKKDLNNSELEKYITYYKNNKMKQVIHRINGLLEGEYIYFYPNGNIMRKGNYKKGNKIGLWKVYDENGQIISEEYF